MGIVIEKLKELGMIKSIIIIIVGLLLLYALLLLLEFLILLLFRKLNDLKNYKDEKLLKKLLKPKREIISGIHDPDNGQMYYECEFWKWQENKFKSMNRACENRQDLEIKYVQIRDLKNDRGKIRRYKKQIRAYYLA